MGDHADDLRYIYEDCMEKFLEDLVHKTHKLEARTLPKIDLTKGGNNG